MGFLSVARSRFSFPYLVIKWLFFSILLALFFFFLKVASGGRIDVSIRQTIFRFWHQNQETDVCSRCQWHRRLSLEEKKKKKIPGKSTDGCRRCPSEEKPVDVHETKRLNEHEQILRWALNSKVEPTNHACLFVNWPNVSHQLRLDDNKRQDSRCRYPIDRFADCIHLKQMKINKEKKRIREEKTGRASSSSFNPVK